MRNVYLVCYDVADSKRLQRTYRKMLGFGDPVQYSIFHCELSPTEKQLLRQALWDLLNWKEDRVMLIDLGPIGGFREDGIEYWGQPRAVPSRRQAVIV